MPSTWLFQCVPDKFDTWTVRQHAKEIAVGDEVFLWRAAGR